MLWQLPFHGIDPVFLRLGPLELRWYGLMYMFAFIAGFFILSRCIRIRRLEMTRDDLYDLLFYMILGVMIGGRLGYIVLYDLQAYIADPAAIIAIWRGGMSFHGGFLGMTAAAVILTRRRGWNFLDIADMCAVGATAGIFLVRMANFINGELYGRPTDLPWAMVFPAGGDVGRHPSQVYEALLEGVGLFLLLGWLYRKRLRSGTTFLGFLAGYGLARFMVEFVREPDAHIGLDLGPFSRGQLLSAPMFLIGTVMLIRAFRAGPVGFGREAADGTRTESSSISGRSDPPAKRRPRRK